MKISAIEQVLRDHPDDLASWQVYGDWLLERGDARGTLIDLQQRLARAHPADRETVQREIAALVARHQPDSATSP